MEAMENLLNLQTMAPHLVLDRLTQAVQIDLVPQDMSGGAEPKALAELVPLLVAYSKSPEAEKMDLVKAEVVTVVTHGQKQAVALWQIRRLDGALNNFGWTEDGQMYLRGSSNSAWEPASKMVAEGQSATLSVGQMTEMVLEILVECQAYEERRIAEGGVRPKYQAPKRR